MLTMRSTEWLPVSRFLRVASLLSRKRATGSHRLSRTFANNMTSILHVLAGIWSLLAVSQLVAFYALLSAKGVAGTIPYSPLLTVGVIAFLASTTIAWLLVVKKSIKLAITLSVVMCIYFPFGTILGVITIVALRNPLNKTRFDLQRVNQ